jgi:hypothetical protein
LRYVYVNRSSIESPSVGSGPPLQLAIKLGNEETPGLADLAL